MRTACYYITLAHSTIETPDGLPGWSTLEMPVLSGYRLLSVTRRLRLRSRLSGCRVCHEIRIDARHSASRMFRLGRSRALLELRRSTQFVNSYGILLAHWRWEGQAERISRRLFGSLSIPLFSHVLVTRVRSMFRRNRCAVSVDLLLCPTKLVLFGNSRPRERSFALRRDELPRTAGRGVLLIARRRRARDVGLLYLSSPKSIDDNQRENQLRCDDLRPVEV